MVIQSDFNDFVLAYIGARTYTADIGSSASVNFTDNALDTVRTTKSATATVSGQNIKMAVRLESGEANTYNINAVLFKADGESTDKSLHTTIAKTATVLIDYEDTITLFIE